MGEETLMRDKHPASDQANAWRLPDLANLDGNWYSPQGERISLDEARQYLPPYTDPVVALATDFKDRTAGVMTMFVPFDLLPARNKTAKPHLYVTLERYSIRRPLRRPKLYQEYSQFAQGETAALAAHDQAVIRVRAAVKYNRAPWRRLYIPYWVYRMFLIIGGLQWMTNVVYVVYTIVTTYGE
jgi:hypothetical protein